MIRTKLDILSDLKQIDPTVDDIYYNEVVDDVMLSFNDDGHDMSLDEFKSGTATWNLMIEFENNHISCRSKE